MFASSIIKRIGATHELHGALNLLISNAGSYITGSIINVDGGFSASIIN